MFRFLLLRLLQAIPTLLVIDAVTFFMVRAIPGGPFDEERTISPAIKEQIQTFYGLDRPLWEQYGAHLMGILQGDFGPSFTIIGRSVSEIIAGAFPTSAALGGTALLIALVLGTGAGIMAAVGRNTLFDYLPMTLAMVGICLPTFVLGPVLQWTVGLEAGLLPVALWEGPTYVILPALTLGLVYAAYIARLSRAGMLEVLNKDFIRTARAKGVPEATILWKHALKGGLLPVISFLGPAFAGIIAGSFVVETIFVIPGLGKQFVLSALNRDYFLIQGVVLFFAALVIFFNLLADFVQIALNPRLRYD